MRISRSALSSIKWISFHIVYIYKLSLEPIFYRAGQNARG
jgi:hypothetical protein